jgi:MFS family permease
VANRSFRLLFLATLGSGIGTWIAVVALTVDVYDRTHSGPWVSALLVVNFLPSVVVGLLFGPLIDRFSRRRLMIASDLARFAVFAALPFVDSVLAIVALAAMAGLGNAFFRPAVLAGLPNLVEADDLPHANALLQATEWVTTGLGPVVGGVLVSASGPSLAYWINAGTFLLSAALLAGISAHLLQSKQGVTKGHWRDLHDGFLAVLRSRALLAALVAFSIVMIAIAGVNVSEIVLAKEAFGAGAFGFGLLWSATGVGLVAGSLVASGWLRRSDIGRVYPAAYVIFGAGVFLAGIAPDVWLASLAMVVSGFGNGIVFVLTVLLVQKGAADSVRGRAFTLIISVHNAILGLAMVAAGPLVDAVGPRWVYVGCGMLIGAGAMIATAMTRGLDFESAPATAPA